MKEAVVFVSGFDAQCQNYRMIPAGTVYETPVYSTGDMDLLLGRLRYIFQM